MLSKNNKRIRTDESETDLDGRDGMPRVPAVEHDSKQAASLPKQMQLVLTYFEEIKDAITFVDALESGVAQDSLQPNEKAAAVKKTLLYVQELLALTDLEVPLDERESESHEFGFRLFQHRLHNKEMRTYVQSCRSTIVYLNQRLAAAESALESAQAEKALGVFPVEDQSEKARLQQIIKKLAAENADLRTKISRASNADLRADRIRRDDVKSLLEQLTIKSMENQQLQEQLTVKSMDNQHLQSRLKNVIVTLERYILTASSLAAGLHGKWNSFVAGQQLDEPLMTINTAIASLFNYCTSKHDQMNAAYVQKNMPLPQLHAFANMATQPLRPQAQAERSTLGDDTTIQQHCVNATPRFQ